jgi:ABC-2 type transport system permease protein
MTSLALPLPAKARRTAFGKIVLNEARLSWRRPVGLLGGLAVPVVLLVIFGNVSAFQKASPAFGGLTPFEVYIPIVILIGIGLLALLGLPVPLASYRELGILRRLSTTPVAPSWLLAAQGIVQFCVGATMTVVIVVTSVAFFGAAAPVSLGGLAVSVLLSMAGLFVIGLMVAAIARTATGANVIGRVVFFPLMFFAGLWLPRALMPTVLLDISNYTPLGAAVQAIQYSMLQGFPPVAPLLVLAGYTVVFGFLARRFFAWE